MTYWNLALQYKFHHISYLQHLKLYFSEFFRTPGISIYMHAPCLIFNIIKYEACTRCLNPHCMRASQTSLPSNLTIRSMISCYLPVQSSTFSATCIMHLFVIYFSCFVVLTNINPHCARGHNTQSARTFSGSYVFLH